VAYGLHDEMRAFYVTDGCHFPPRGVRGGGDARRRPFKITADGRRSAAAHCVDDRRQAVLCIVERRRRLRRSCREVERVREDVLSGFVTFERARDVYGVVFADTELNDALAVDVPATERRRHGLRLRQENA
jgi:N-methylhydantoinase B/oxoprolinase/acetone carboxylase alpha subunit